MNHYKTIEQALILASTFGATYSEATKALAALRELQAERRNVHACDIGLCIHDGRCREVWQAKQADHIPDASKMVPAQQATSTAGQIDQSNLATIAGLEAATGHLSAMVDELRVLLGRALENFTTLHNAAKPDEDGPDIDAIIPGAVFARFVNEDAAIRYALNQTCHADALKSTQPARQAQKPVQFLCDATRFKVRQHEGRDAAHIFGLPSELNGRWVALVAAEDDCHLALTPAAPSRELVQQARDALAKFATFGAVGTRDVDVAQAQAAISACDKWLGG